MPSKKDTGRPEPTLASTPEGESDSGGWGDVRFDRIEDAIDDIRQGRMIIVVDDEDRENEGDLIMAAAPVQAEDVNFLATHGRGLICAPCSGERLDELVDFGSGTCWSSG